VVPAPTITSISPSSGTTAGGTSVTITGTNLSDSTSVTFGGTVATVVSSSSTQITVTTPAKSAGSAAVVVITAGGSVTSASNYTYVAPPTVTKLTPNTGPNSGGTLVTITGTNLGIVNSVKFGGVIGELISSSPTQITVRTPKTALKSQTPVVVSTPGGTVSAGNFVFNSSSSPNK
jgi:hypothetical protein